MQRIIKLMENQTNCVNVITATTEPSWIPSLLWWKSKLWQLPDCLLVRDVAWKSCYAVSWKEELAECHTFSETLEFCVHWLEL